MTPKDLAERIKTEIASEVEAGRIPVTVKDFSELHKHCAANELGDAQEVWASLGSGDVADAFINQAQSIVDQWIRDGGLR